MINEAKELFSAGKLYLSGDFLTSKDLSKDEFDQLFSSDYYETYHFDINNNTGTVSIEELNFVYADFHELLESALSCDLDTFPSELIVLSKGTSFIQIGHFAEHIKGWVQFFKIIADHSFPNDRNNESWSYVFVDQKAKKSSTVVSFDPSQIHSSVIESLISSITSPSRLLESCTQEDAHKGEKLSTMRVSIIQLAEDQGLTFVDFLEFGEELLNNFHVNYETYLRSFSFEEFVKDLEDDVGDFTNKVEEQIQGFYVQALAVPGAVILASALRGAEKNISLALIFSAALALFLVFRSLVSKTKFIKRIAENTLTKLDLYKRRTTDIDNSFARDTISEKIDKAIESVDETRVDSIKDITNLRDVIIVFIVFYLITATVFWKF